MYPCVIIFNCLQCVFADAVERIRGLLASRAIVFEGTFYGSRKKHGLYEVVKVGKVEHGTMPVTEDLTEFDRVAFYLLKDGWEFSLALVREEEQTELTIAFDSDKFLTDLGEGWLVGVMAGLLSEFELEAGIFDRDDYGNVYSIATEKILQELTSDAYRSRGRPLLTVIRSERIDNMTRNAIRQTGCRPSVVVSGYDVFSWIEKQRET